MFVDPILSDAIRLLRRRKYEKTIEFLEKIDISRYHNSFPYYYTLAVACLRAKQFWGAYGYFKQARELKMRDPWVLLGLGVYFLHRGDTDRAIDYYLEVQDLEPKNKKSLKALRLIRKHGGSEAMAASINKGKYAALYPPVPKLPRSRKRAALALACLLLTSIAALGVLYKFSLIRLPEKWSGREGYAGTVLEREERAAPVQMDGKYRYSLSREEILNLYASARNLFAEYRDEAAKVALNRIIESNAAEPVKNKARLLISYMPVPAFHTLKDFFSYETVIQDPPLYRDCYVIWRGMAAGLRLLQEGTEFTLLAGYDTLSAITGMVPVRFAMAVRINEERPLEVLGRVVPVITPNGLDVRLEGAAVHQSGLLEAPPDMAAPARSGP
ncbi:MAG: tetratricopeptide repeat protein [Treponema sp.]|jgi:tetratricopeptide (TPR) repeat protein|nr:tetratricopeptide repeat protein [Treponema sp.]